MVLWRQTLSYSVKVWNVLLRNDAVVSPYKQIWNPDADLKRFRVFGCVCFFYKSDKKPPIDAGRQLGYFVGLR